jgi:hypothetical protein
MKNLKCKRFGNAALAIFFLLATVIPLTANATGIFSIYVESEGQTYTQGFSSFQDMIDNFDVYVFDQHFTGYDPDTSGIHTVLNFRGLPIETSISPGSNTIQVTIPSIGIAEVFAGATRDDSVDMLEDWIKENTDDVLEKMVRYLVENTSTDPIAGNPSSLMSTMAANDFENGFTSLTTNIMASQTPTPPEGVENENVNLIALQANFGSLKAGDYDGSYYRLPLSYTFRSDVDERRQLRVSLPIGVMTLEDSKSYSAGLGLAFSIPMTQTWTLTPAVNYAGVGSADLAAAATMASASLASALSLKAGYATVNIGNMLGHYTTLKFKYDDFEYDPDIKNTVLRNGIMVSIPIRKKYVGEVFLTDTRYFGTNLYIEAYNEIGFAFGLVRISSEKAKNRIKNYLRSFRVGATYTFDGDYDAIELNFGYTF